jgi:hypothetical protein
MIFDMRWTMYPLPSKVGSPLKGGLNPVSTKIGFGFSPPLGGLGGK